MKAAAALALVALAGCGTIEDLAGSRYSEACFGPGPAPHVFGGVRVDVFTAGQAHTWGAVHYVDVPFSFVLDLALLPVSIPPALFYDPDPADELEVPK